MRVLVVAAFLATAVLAGCAAPDAPEEDNGGARDGNGAPSNGNEGPGGFGFEEVVTGLENPVHVTHAVDGSDRLFIVEQSGAVRVWRNGTLLDAPFLDVSQRVSKGGEQGLLSIAFHPDYPDENAVFVSFTNADGASVVERWRVPAGDPDRADPASATPVIEVPQPYANHNGGLIAFGPDGYLYVGLGDGGGAGDPDDNGQDRGTLLGALLRLDVDRQDGYGVPSANPFVDDPDARSEIWAYGLRNPWRFSFDRATGDLFIADAGQGDRETVYHQPAGSAGGENYGWPAWEGTKRFREDVPAPEDAVFPVAEYNLTGDHCVIVGGSVYRGAEVPALDGVYVYADYCSGVMWGLTRVDGEWVSEEIMDTDYRVSAFGEDEDGELHVVDRGGRVLRLVPGDTRVPGALRGES